MNEIVTKEDLRQFGVLLVDKIQALFNDNPEDLINRFTTTLGNGASIQNLNLEIFLIMLMTQIFDLK